MFKEVTKLYQDKYIDLKDYYVKTAIKNKQNITVSYRGKTMVLTPQDLKEKRLILNKDPIISKVYPDQSYYLYSYLWKPQTEEEELKEFSKNYL